MSIFNKFFSKDRVNKILQDKNSQVQGMFENIAEDYDWMNNLISMGTHLAIKKTAIKKVPVRSNSKILDLCTGTGDIARIIAKKYPEAVITGVDFSQNMLDIAEKKSKSFKNIEFIKANVLSLPFEDNSFDLCFISFGLRNLPDLKQGINEMKRVVKNEGYIVNIDLGKPKGVLSGIIRLYFNIVVPLIGKLIHGHFTPYKYLPESNKSFPSQDELVKIFQDMGFSEVKNYNYAFGSIAQQVARIKK